MSEEILINVTPMETRSAVIENGVVQEIFVERDARRGLVGGIFKGKVVRVLPGMQAAFVDIGLEKAAFLHAREIYLPDLHVDRVEGNGVEVVPNINQLVQEGQPLVVQVIKDMIGTKGARLTTHFSIPSRYLVYMPDSNHVGISLRIENEDERERLKAVVEKILGEQNEESKGYIVRTAAEGVSESALREDLQFLSKLGRSVVEKAHKAPVISVVHEDLPLYARMLRDEVRPDLEKVRIDSQEIYFKVLEFVREFIPDIEPVIEYYPGERPVFDLYGVEQEIQKALLRQVPLKSGGHIVLDQTEAMTTIDVNTGGFVGHRNLEDTIFKTNLEAAQTIARQLRLRNLGGIIIIDFIDMEDDEHKRQVLRIFEKQLERDHARTGVNQFSALGLVEMTRQRTRESLERVLCEDCPTCFGRRSIKSVETVCYDIFREILRQERDYEASSFLVIASQLVIDRLLDEEGKNAADLEQFIGKGIRYQVEALYGQEQYDVILIT